MNGVTILAITKATVSSGHFPKVGSDHLATSQIVLGRPERLGALNISPARGSLQDVITSAIESYEALFGRDMCIRRQFAHS